MKLTPATLSALQDTPQALSELTSICLPDRGITSIEDISAATDLRKVDLHGNSLKNADSLAGLRYCTGITWLHLAGNDYGNVCPPGTVLEKMRGLKVLNMSNNRIVRFSVPDLSRLSALNALILSHNEIPVLEKDTFAALRNLNTLVLSHNKLGVLPEGMFATMANLKKLSLAHNQLKFFPIGLPTNLQELRLNDNKIPTPSMKPQFPPSLQLLDVGNNLLQSLEPSLGLALSTLPNLVNLNMKGNPVCKLPGYRESVLLACSESGKGTGLRILDGNRFDEKFLQRKKKMDAAKRKKETKEKKELNLKKASTAADETPDKGKGSNRSVPPKGVKRKALSDGVSGGELAKAKKLRRDGVVAVIEAEPARKKKAGAATAFDPSVLESSDGFGTAIAGWD
ncbi:hypothetical protein DFJ74DRAFT_700837 [Hyaloraphidium curvatum]|nr:hypothetical protein DFJ74DRAFT_700837 [Hyaloraphidium curvatum]